MRHAQTIAMARGLLAEGREADVARMVAPLLSGPGDWNAADDTSQILLRALLARVRLLRHGDAAHVLALLEPFESLSRREALEPGVRAEVALWLGWAHAWEDGATYDDARALNLLDEAERLFREELDTGGRCWTLIGQAQAYFTIDEYQLMAQALEEAGALQEKLQDPQATLWIHDLSVSGARFRGHYAQAQTAINGLKTLGERYNNPLALGRARAHQAALNFDLGRPPETIIEEAFEAEAILTRSVVKAGYPLLAAFRTHILALVRSGSLGEADAVIDQAMRAVGDVPAAPGHILKQRALLLMIRSDYDEAQRLLDDLLGQMQSVQHRLLASSVALLRSELFMRQGDPARAYEWAGRAYRNARETGHIGQQLRALLHQAWFSTALNDTAAARAHLSEAEKFSGFFSVLPYAALRFRALGYLANVEGEQKDARAYFAQALSAYSLVGNLYSTALIQLEMARLGRTDDPVRTRPLLEAAVLTFNQLQARAELEEARALLRTWPLEAEGTAEAMETTIGAALARASLSVELVAETWLQAVMRLLPGRWLAVYRCQQDGPWVCVRQHGTPPVDLAFPNPNQQEHCTPGIHWLRLRSQPGPSFLFGVARTTEDDPAWDVAQSRIRPWMPVVSLALDHALLRARRLDTAYGFDAFEEDEPQIPLENFVYASTALRNVVRQIHRIRASHSPVLITGESGTGKELIAQAVHRTSERKHNALVAFNCSNVPHDLFDSHLFGHEKGAFTGATRANPGVIRAADGATLFLDEIGDLPLDVQPKLLRFLQEGEIFPLGAKRPVRVNVRVVAATNQDLEPLIRAGRFREDLYYRLNVIPIRIPPLRERREDIPLLVRHFLTVLRPEGAPTASITNRALDALLHYTWPGNIRQLRNEVERALVFVGSEPAPMIDLHDLSAVVAEAPDEPEAALDPRAAQEQVLLPGNDLDDILARTEKALIERVLANTRGHVTNAADMLGLTRQGLYKKMKRLNIDLVHFQNRTPQPTGGAVPYFN